MTAPSPDQQPKDWPSVNWKDGRPYGYCPECGRDERTQQPDIRALVIEALKLALFYLDNSDSPGGCDGKQKNCGHCEAIRAVKAAIKLATKST